MFIVFDTLSCMTCTKRLHSKRSFFQSPFEMCSCYLTSIFFANSMLTDKKPSIWRSYEIGVNQLVNIKQCSTCNISNPVQAIF